MSQRNILFGYKVLGGKYEIISSEAEIVKEAFERYIAGEAFKQIADSFLERGITYYRDNRTWNKNMISRMVGDKRYLGDTQYPSIITSKAFGLSENMRQGKSAKKTELPEITELIKSKLICGSCGQRIYLASVDLLRRLLRDNMFERKILERLNRLNAKSMNCKAVALK